MFYAQSTEKGHIRVKQNVIPTTSTNLIAIHYLKYIPPFVIYFL